MNPIRILHSADFHYSRDNQESALKSLRAFYEYGRDNGVDLYIIAGDLFDRAVQNTANSGFPKLVRVIQEMMNIAPVVAVAGTPTHDIAGCYEALEKIKAKHAFRLIDQATWSPPVAWLCEDGHIEVEVWSEENPVSDGHEARLMILGCGEPSKEWFLRDKSLGRDEATQAVRDGMRQLLLGMGAVRKQYADIPCLLIYHGSVEGASLCNGQTLPMGELAIGRDDLALVGADYYALGHIHKAQQVGDLPAYYSGSAFPVDWGELDQKGFYEVGFQGGIIDKQRFEKMLVHQIPYPHPPRKKLVLSGTESAAGIEGFQTWEVRRLPKGVSFDKEAELAWLETHGALPGSRVTVEVIPTETVRAGEIRDAKGLADKLRIYSQNSGEDISDLVMHKAGQLEAEARTEGLAGEGLHIRLDCLILRGAIGIMKGLGREEITVDFSAYDPGLVALVGINGAGKTTLIENCHPFPTMLTRSGKLQDHFCLRDSYRDLYFTDERTDCRYRAFIQIDGQNVTGKCEYHLYREGMPLTDGRKESYENEINRLFGSLALFQRSVFTAQKNTKGNPDLSEATKGERKSLFRELRGLDYLQLYSESAREEAKGIEQTILTDRGRIQSLEELVAGSSIKEDELTGLVIQRDEQAEALKKMEASGKQLKTETELLREKVEANRRVVEHIEEAKKRGGDLGAEMRDLAQKAKQYNEAVQHKGEAEAIIQQAEVLRTDQGRLSDERAKIQEKREQRLTEHRDRSEAVAHQEKGLQATKAEIDAKTGEIRAKKAGFVAKIDQIRAFLEKTVECPKCGYEFAPGGKEQQQALEDLQSHLQSQVWELDKELTEQGKASTDIRQQIDVLEYPPEPKLPGFGEIDTKLNEIAEQLNQLDVTEMRAVLQRAQEANARLEEMEKRRHQINSEQARLEVEIEDLNKQFDFSVQHRYDEKQAELIGAENAYRTARDTLKTLEASIVSLEKQIDELGKKAGELLQLKAAVEDKQNDAAEWRWLERACGPDGIQALELDAMGPGIAEIANRLLQAAYGSRFQVEFRTTRIGGQGSKRKQIEDFQIWVLDSEDGSEQQMETLSGGESVWIKRAIYDAFGIVRDQNTGQRFLTCFQDEADGALDPRARLAYFRMLEAAHQESGRHHTIVITHSAEAQEMITQRIVMSELQAAENPPATNGERKMSRGTMQLGLG